MKFQIFSTMLLLLNAGYNANNAVTFIDAIIMGEIDVVKKIFKHRLDNIREWGLEVAAHCNRFEIAKFFIIDRRIMPRNDDLFLAIRNHQNLDMIKLLVENGEFRITREHLNAVDSTRNQTIISYLNQKYQGLIPSVEPDIVEVAPSAPPHTFDVPISFIEAIEKA